MQVRRPSGKRPYAVFVSPISRRYPALSSLKPAACVVVVDPDARTPLPVARVQSALGLTRAEAQLAALLAAGYELHEAATRLGITYGTARTRLAAVFEKTDTRRQGELIVLLLSILAVP